MSRFDNVVEAALCLGLMAFASNVCADNPSAVKPYQSEQLQVAKEIKKERLRTRTSISVPPRTQLILFMDEWGRVTVKDPNGEPFVPCIPCPTSYVHKHPEDEHCDVLRKRARRLSEEMGVDLGICAALTRSTVNAVIPVTILQTHRNPDCSFVQAFGTTLTSQGSASEEQLRKFLEALGLSPEQVNYILANPDASCLQ